MANGKRTRNIYIPLCIYFNFYSPECQYPKLEFTFHYVSISTSLPAEYGLVIMNLHSTMYLFQPRNTTGVIPVQYNLHSTMYLFQRQMRNGCICRMKAIYIPLCIYFNRLGSFGSHNHCKFTFHYVSISTPRRLSRIQALCNLHSTMYLFQLQIFSSNTNLGN